MLSTGDRSSGCRIAASILAALFAGAPAASGDGGAPTQRVVASERYRASGIHRFFWGNDYRDLWATPIEVEVLDLASYAGGLTPVRKVGRRETKGLAFRGADGRNYTFRSIDKEAERLLSEELRGTVANDIVQDQIAAAHPAGPVIVDELEAAAGVLDVPSRLIVLPDDAALGEFRQEYAGWYGTISEYPSAVSETNPGFMGATEILDHREMYRRFRAGPADRPDVRVLLKTRLFEVLVGDWDRHREQYRWTKLPGRELWQPVPEDRDQAFCRFEGLVMTLARGRVRELVNFGPKYPNMLGQTWVGRDQDRVLLSGLDWSVWEETARELQGRITDEVIERAARRMPPEYFAIDGPRIIADLKSRRDRLAEAARRFYKILANQVDVHGTDAAELAETERIEGGDVEVRISLRGPGASAEPYFRRRFRRSETREIRVDLHGGDDRIVVRGAGGGIPIRVVGGQGADVLDDSGGGIRFYDSDPGEIRKGPGTSVDRRPYTAPVVHPNAPWIPERDWGHQIYGVPWLSWSADYGLFLGGGVDFARFGFRKSPYANRHRLRLGYALEAEVARADYRGEFRRENSRVYGTLYALASGIEILRFYGFGNETSDELGDNFYKVRQRQYALAPAVTFPLAGKLEATIAPVVKYASTRDEEGSLIGEQPPYGAGEFGQVGGLARLELDTRDNERLPTRGLHLQADGTFYPKAWDVTEEFGGVWGEASTYLTARGSHQTTLSLRAGGKKVWGNYPFHEAAFIGGGGFFGGSQAVRGLRQNRYAGDASVFGNAELRVRLGRMNLVLPADVGLFALGDAGRVFLEGEDSDRWHTGYGGGLWLSYLSPNNTVSLAVARGEGRTAVYFRFGFAF